MLKLFTFRFVARYICHLLSSSTAVDKIFQDDCQGIIIRSWFRCLIGLNEKHPLSLELTRFSFFLVFINIITINFSLKHAGFALKLLEIHMFQYNCATFVLLLWTSLRFNYLGFAPLHRSGFNLEFETLFESI